MIFHSYKITYSPCKNNDFFFPATIFGSSWRMLSKCHLAFLHTFKSNNTITHSSKSFICIFKATERTAGLQEDDSAHARGLELGGL